MREKPAIDVLIMIEPVIKSPSMRARKSPKERYYLWYHRGERVKIDEVMLEQRLKNVNMVCSVDTLVMRLYNTHCIVINTETGEVMDGSAAA